MGDHKAGSTGNMHQAEATDTLLAAPRQLLAVLDAISDVVFRLDIEPDGYRFSYINLSFLRATGLRREQVLGRRVEEVIPEPSLQMVLGKYDRARRTGDVVSWMETTPYPSGLRRGEVTVRRVVDDEGRALSLVGTVHDVTAAYEYEERLREHAYTDPLTRLPNRRHFNMLLNERMATRPESALALIYIDLAIHYVNDTYGRECGDEVLRQAPPRITENLGEDAVIGRVAGDELAVLLPCPADTRQLAGMANALLARLEMPFVMSERSARITPSIGMATYPDDAANARDLIRSGNAAMHAAKQDGRSAVRFYDNALATHIRQRIDLRNKLQQAMEKEQFVLHYQPQIDSRTGRCVSLEALMRWEHPDAGLTAAETYIDVLEHSSLIVPLGLWVIETACRQLKAMREAGFGDVAISVNVSARQLTAHSTASPDHTEAENLQHHLADCLQRYGIEAGRLELELTETSLMSDPRRAALFLEQFRRLGIKVLVDDFGTGYSSLAYLSRLPIDMLKIDREFVSDILDEDGAETRGAAITDLIIQFAHRLGLGVVAEGVENAIQAEHLRAHGCDRLQGFHLARPMPADAVVDYLRRPPSGEAH